MPNIINNYIIPVLTDVQSFIHADINIQRNCIYKVVRLINHLRYGIKIKYYHN